MKRYKDMTTKELAAATDEEKKTLLELEYAEAGIVVWPRPEAPDKPAFTLKPIGKVFSVNGIYFKNIDDAKAVLNAEKIYADYDYVLDKQCYRESTRSYHGEYAIQAIDLYDYREITEFKKSIKDYEQKKNDYDKQIKEYDKYMESTQSISSDFYDTYYDAVEYERKVISAKGQYKKYLELAQGNKDTAQRFFMNAFNKSEDDVVFVNRVMLEVEAEANTETK